MEVAGSGWGFWLAESSPPDPPERTLVVVRIRAVFVCGSRGPKTRLCKKTIEAMQLRELTENTQQSCLRRVAAVATHYQCAPNLLTKEQIQEYVRQLSVDRSLAWKP